MDRTPAEVKAHHAAIEAIRDRWFEGEITMRQKRDLIREEVRFFRGQVPSRQLVLTVPRSDYEEDPQEMWWQK